MSTVRSRRPFHRNWIVGLAGAIALIGSAAVPAASAPVPRLRPPAIKQLPAPNIEVVPRPTVAIPDEFAAASRYGTDDPGTVAVLDDASAGLADDVDASASKVAANAEAKMRIKACAGEGLKSAGQSYGEDVTEAAGVGAGPPSPDFTEVSALTAACLGEFFPNTPEELFELGNHLADLAAERAQEAYSADSSAAVLASWMTTAGAEQSSSESLVADTSIGGGSDSDEPYEDSSFPTWVLIVAIVAAGGVLTLIVRAKRS